MGERGKRGDGEIGFLRRRGQGAGGKRDPCELLPLDRQCDAERA